MELMDFRSPTPKSARPVFKWRILVVDDEAGMVESLRMLLTQMGYDVTTALDGHSVIDFSRFHDVVDHHPSDHSPVDASP